MATPLRVGILNDMSAGPPGPADTPRWLKLCTDELIEAGRIDRRVEFVQADGLGLPSGSAAAVERAFKALVEQDVLMIVGPAIGDNALVATPLAEQHCVPTINWAGAERARGEYMFHLQVGSHEDESIVLARHLKALGANHVAVVYDRSPIGKRHMEFLQDEADILGLRIAASQSISPLTESGALDICPLLKSADALVYLGLGISAPAVAQSAKQHGWSGPSLMNTAGIRGYQPDFSSTIDGWIYVDMFSDQNTTLASIHKRLGEPTIRKLAVAKGYDLGRLCAEGLARASERTREGVKHGLEAIKWLPAAEGQEGTLLGFGRQDRGALHGRYLVLRQWREGQTYEVGQ